MSFDPAAFEEITPQCQGKVKYERVMGSTSDEAREDIIAGRSSSGSIYLTEYQTGGRGRGANRWVCPEGEGLLFSIVLEPDVEKSLWYRMSLAVGLAIVESVRKLGIEAEVKWPNDVFIGHQKLGGILIENVNDFLIVGVGLNVNVREFPDEVADRATSLSRHLSEIEDLDKGEFLSKFLSSIVHSIYRNGSMIGDSFEYLIDQVMSCFYLRNKEVSLLMNGKIVEGEVLGMTENGYLLLKEAGDACEIVEIPQAQEIKILKTS